MVLGESSAWIAALTSYRAFMLAGGWSSGTVAVKVKYLRRLERATGEADPFAVTEDQLTIFMAHDGWLPETRKSARAALAGFYKWAYEHGRMDHNPADRLPKIKVPDASPRPAPDEALDAALERSDSRTRLMLLLAARGGLRRAEIAALHTSHVEGSMLRVRGKGGKVRSVPLHPEVADFLKGLPEGYVFPGQDGGHLSPDRVGRVMSDALGPGWTAHTLRHRFATRGYQTSGGDIFTMQQLLGHSSSDTTRRYTQLPQDAALAVVMAS
jgi:integrase